MIEMSGGIVIFLFNRQLLAYVVDLGVVVYGIISNSALIVNSISNGISQAAQPLMAVNFGAGERERTEKTKKLGEIAALCAGIFFAVSGIARPDIIIRMFIEPQPEIVAMAVPAVRIYFLSFLMTGINLLYSTYFQSVLMPGKALGLCLLRGLVLNGILVMALPVFLGVKGIWITMTITEFVTAAAGKWLMRKRC